MKNPTYLLLSLPTTSLSLTRVKTTVILQNRKLNFERNNECEENCMVNRMPNYKIKIMVQFTEHRILQKKRFWFALVKLTFFGG